MSVVQKLPQIGQQVDFAMDAQRPLAPKSLSDTTLESNSGVSREMGASQHNLKVPPSVLDRLKSEDGSESKSGSVSSSAPSAATTPARSRSYNNDSSAAIFSILDANGTAKSTPKGNSAVTPSESPTIPQPEEDPADRRIKHRSATDLETRGTSKLEFQEEEHPHHHNRMDTSISSSRRSGSTEIPRSHVMRSQTFQKDSPGLLYSFPQSAATGMGTRSRRLSTNLPDEFPVEWCPLEKEFKSSSRMPLKRPKQIGEGGYACVKLMRKRGEGPEKLFAVKQFRGRDSWETEDDYVKKVKSEYCIAKSCHHPNIVEPVRLCFSHGIWSEVMEYCQNGELFSLLEKKYLTLEDKFCFFKQLLYGVDYLHNHGIAHRDLKPENIMLTRDGCVKIIDFGLSEIFSGPHPSFRIGMDESAFKVGQIRKSAPAVFGSQPYISPEVAAADKAYDPRGLDVWSCGINFLSMIFGVHPWVKAAPDNTNYKKYLGGWNTWLKKHPEGIIEPGSSDYPQCGKLFSLLRNQSLERLVLRMLHPDPDKRISIADALVSDVVRKMDCCQRESYEVNPGSTGIKHNHTPPSTPKEHKFPVKEWLHRRAESGRGVGKK